MVTSSSEDVGWIATVRSKSAFVAPILTATEKPCSISSQPRPIMWMPNTCHVTSNVARLRVHTTTCTSTFSEGSWQMSFILQGDLRAVTAWYMGVKLDV